MLSPFRGFYDAQSEVDRLFSEMLGGLGRRRREEGQRLSAWALAMDALTKNGDLVIVPSFLGSSKRMWTSPCRTGS